MIINVYVVGVHGSFDHPHLRPEVSCLHSHGVADQIDTRFGALDWCLAAAVRHALDVAVTLPALAPMNAVHLRLASMANIIAADFELPEPPTHRWHEFMVELFGRNEVGSRRSPVSRYAGKPNAATLEYIEFGKSYELDAREYSIVHDLLASAGAFIVAESITLHDIVDQWDLSGRDGFVVAELVRGLQHACQIGVRLSEAAKTGAWLDLLSSHGFAPPPVPVARAKTASTRKPSTNGRMSDIFDDFVDRIVLIVEPMDDARRRALTVRAIKTIRESMLELDESRSAKQVVVVSATSGRQSEPLPLAGWSSTSAMDNDAGGVATSFDYMLDRVARTVDTFGQADNRVATLDASTIDSTEAELRSNRHWDQAPESPCLGVSELRPTLLIVLANSSSGGAEHLFPGSPAGDYQHPDRIPRDQWRSLLDRASVVLISESPLATGLDALVTSWSATGVRALQYHCLDTSISLKVPFTEDKSRPTLWQPPPALATESAGQRRLHYWQQLRDARPLRLTSTRTAILVTPLLIVAGLLIAKLTPASMLAVLTGVSGVLAGYLLSTDSSRPFRFRRQGSGRARGLGIDSFRRR